MQFKTRPYHLLLVTGVVLVLISFFLNPKRTVDLHLHDTYFIIGHRHFFWLFAIIVWLLWALYIVSRKVLFSARLTWIHVVFTVIPVVLIICAGYFQENIYPASRTNLDMSDWRAFNALQMNMKLVGLGIIVLPFVQIVYLVNLFIGIFKRVRFIN